MTNGPIKPSIQAALDEGKIQLTVTVDDRVAEVLRHTPSVAGSHRRPGDDSVFDPNDPDQQGLPLAGFKVEPELSLLDAMRYGEDRMPGGMGNDIRETHLPIRDVLATHMDFGHAIRCMEAGNRVQREGWNGKGMWIAISGLEGPRSVIATNFWSKHASDYAREIGGAALVLPCIIMKTATGEILMGWLASQSDMLAHDWRIVP
jgi:hypothetical protein